MGTLFQLQDERKSQEIFLIQTIQLIQMYGHNNWDEVAQPPEIVYV